MASEPLILARAYDVMVLLDLATANLPLAYDHAERRLALARALGAPTLEIAPRMYLAFADVLAKGRKFYPKNEEFWMAIAGPAASFVIGVGLPVDGGFTAH